MSFSPTVSVFLLIGEFWKICDSLLSVFTAIRRVYSLKYCYLSVYACKAVCVCVCSEQVSVCGDYSERNGGRTCEYSVSVC